MEEDGKRESYHLSGSRFASNSTAAAGRSRMATRAGWPVALVKDKCRLPSRPCDINFGSSVMCASLGISTEVRESVRGLRDGTQRTADTIQWYKRLKGNSGVGRVKWVRSGVEVGYMEE